MHVYYGVDIGGTNVKAALVTDAGELLHKTSIPTLPERGFADLAARIYATFTDSARAAGVPVASVAGVGMGVPAFLDAEAGFVHEAVNLGWVELPLGPLMADVFRLPVAIDNDANLAALGESWIGAGAGRRVVLCVTVGTGVGAGIVLDGRLYRGTNGMAGEIGHLVVRPHAGLPCNCGQTGCLETVASATAIVREARTALAPLGRDGEVAAAEDVFRLAAEGLRAAELVVADAAAWLGYGLSLASVTLNPDVIIIGGGVSRAGDTFLAPVREAFARYTQRCVRDAAELTAARLGNDAGVIGAARLAAQAAGER